MQNFGFDTILGWLWTAAPAVLGGAGGYAFYRFIGCKTGACPISRNPWLSTIAGALIGALLLSK